MSHLQQNSRTLYINKNSTHPFPGIELPEDYNMHEVPWTEDGGPVKVNFSINLSSILAIDEPKQVCFDVYFSPVINILFPFRCLYFRTQLRAQQRTSLTVS